MNVNYRNSCIEKKGSKCYNKYKYTVTRFFYDKSFPPSFFKLRQIFSKISKFFAIILVKMHKFATNKDYNTGNSCSEDLQTSDIRSLKQLNLSAFGRFIVKNRFIGKPRYDAVFRFKILPPSSRVIARFNCSNLFTSRSQSEDLRNMYRILITVETPR